MAIIKFELNKGVNLTVRRGVDVYFYLGATSSWHYLAFLRSNARCVQVRFRVVFVLGVWLPCFLVVRQTETRHLPIQD